MIKGVEVSIGFEFESGTSRNLKILIFPEGNGYLYFAQACGF